MSAKEIDKIFIDSFHNQFSDIKKTKYIDRDLSWLDFNMRVLKQILRKDIPLYEKFRFISIASSNLDEFIMVRYGSDVNFLRNFEYGKEIKNPINFSSNIRSVNHYENYMKAIKKFRKMIGEAYEYLMKEKESQELINLVKYKDLNGKEKRKVWNIYQKEIYPLLSPINIDKAKELPIIHSRTMNFVVLLEHKTSLLVSVVNINPSVPRVFDIGNGEKSKHILLEDIVGEFIQSLYIGNVYQIKEIGNMKLLRNADVEIQKSEDIYLTDRMRNMLKQRESEEVLFITLSKNISKEFTQIILNTFGVEKTNVFKTDGIIDYKFLDDIQHSNKKWSFEPFQSRISKDLIGEQDIFSAIDKKDIVLHHPYDNFNTVIKFIQQGADDPDTISIRQTLYRVSSTDSPIVEALCSAALKGKEVIVLLELKARFDEFRNLLLVEKMLDAGCRLVYGSENLKTHSKMSLIVKKRKKKLKAYAHIGTGNYNDKTANIYEDYSYFTSRKSICGDLLKFFNMITTGSNTTEEMKHISVSPFTLRSKLEKMIDHEIKVSQEGGCGLIIIKSNSISDKRIIDKLYAAGKSGVKIFIVCRGICSMKPIYNNITIKSVIGRFLEHSRVYYFHNQKTSRLFLSSSDLLTRNLDRRYELLVPVKGEEGTNILNTLMWYVKDTENSFWMDTCGNYNQYHEGKKINVHKLFMGDIESHNNIFQDIDKELNLKKYKNKA